MTDAQLQQVINVVEKTFLHTKDQQHGLSHATRVNKNAYKIAKLLNITGLDYHLLSACCWLHDVWTTTQPKSAWNYFSEPKLAQQAAQKILNNLPVSGSDRQIIENAIYHHPFSFPFRKLNRHRDIYSRILQDADTLDIFHPHRYGNKNWFTKIGQRHLELFLNYPSIADQNSLFPQ